MNDCYQLEKNINICINLNNVSFFQKQEDHVLVVYNGGNAQQLFPPLKTGRSDQDRVNEFFNLIAERCECEGQYLLFSNFGLK